MSSFSLRVSLILAIDLLFLLWYGSTLSISKYEANIFFYADGWIHQLLEIATTLLGQNDMALRLPFLLMHLINAILIVLISLKYVKRQEDIYWILVLYLLIPGINSAALVVNQATPIILLTLLFIYIEQKQKLLSALFLILLSLLDNAFFFLIVAVFVYGLVNRYRVLLIASGIGIIGNATVFGIDIVLQNRGYFLDIFNTYAAIFSPPLFLFFIYTIYHLGVKERKALPLLWYIATISFVLALGLSLKQNLLLEEIAPFSVIAAPLMVMLFLNSYRIRLPEFRKIYQIVLTLVMGFLLLNSLVVFYNKPLYLLLDNPKKHFSYEHHFTKELVRQLHKKGIRSVDSSDKSLLSKLKFYGIEGGGEMEISTSKLNNYDDSIVMNVFNVPIEHFYLRIKR
jgi:hypothetical protein